ncbi:hypothetical protein AB7M29_004858 [Pseudomonas sp. F-14 TE3623]
MKFRYFRFFLIISVLFLNACSAMTDNTCSSVECQQFEAQNTELKVWWSPALRNSVDEYSLVPVHE